MLFKKEDIGRRGFLERDCRCLSDLTYFNYIYIDIYTFKKFNFYGAEKRKASFVIYEIIKNLCLLKDKRQKM